MGKDIEFDPNALCDGCGCRGAYDFMGDYLCFDCANLVIGADDKCFEGCGCNGSCGLSIDAKPEEELPEEEDPQDE